MYNSLHSIDNAFEIQFGADVNLAFRQGELKLANTVRTKYDVKGDITTFNKIVNNDVLHGIPVECNLSDYYTGEWVEDLDELKSSEDDRKLQAFMQVFSLVRKSDELVISALNKATNEIAADDSGMTLDKIKAAIKELDSKNAPNDGERYIIMTGRQFDEITRNNQFPDEFLVHHKIFPEVGRLKWLGLNWILENDLPLNPKDSIRTCFIYHKNAIGFAVGSSVKTDISWNKQRHAHFVSTGMNYGATLIDDEGVVKIMCKE